MTEQKHSRADALTDHMFGMFLRALPKRLSDDESDRAMLRKACEWLLAASPVEQPAAAPIDDARECLMDVVSHHHNIVAGLNARLMAACREGDSDTAAYWGREIEVARRMKGQAERALSQTAPSPTDRRHVGDSKFEGWYSDYAAKGESNPKQIARDAYAAGMGDMTPQPAPSPADERAAFDPKAVADSLASMLVVWVDDCMRMNLDWRDMSGVIEKRVRRLMARSASANETAAEGAMIDVTLPYENALHELIRKILPDLDSGDILADAQTAINAVAGRAMTDAQIDAIWANLDARGSSLYEPHQWEVEMRRRFARTILSCSPAMAVEAVGIVHRPAPNGDDFSVEWLSPPAAGKLYAAPQPAQADARVGLTDEQREAIEHAASCLDLSELSAERELAHELRVIASRVAQPHPKCHGCPINPTCPSTTCGVSQPEPRAEVADVQWWLAELDQYGNPKLSGGAHSERAGADKAMYLIKNLDLDNKGKRWAVARVELSEPRPSADGVNHDAVSAGRAMVDAARVGGA